MAKQTRGSLRDLALQQVLLRFLIKHGFSCVDTPRGEVTRAGGEYIQPIHVAAELGDALILELLLKAGVDRDPLYHGCTPYEIAKAQDQNGSHSLCVKLLEDALTVKSEVL
ncbi:Caskin-2 [Durusdinium trenchii]|uniref:Caskin-2 n=1 Tax=Durusdinium trenchii TaxID=1381693 RepID=A0ABP0NQW0_9DINO